ncbi:MAG: hypothetical protein CMH64_02560 [Nanoarchaeota archaeon]|nr:hypothetical protein [Nanoarchaeota archaeon]|tara:strand:- start:1081 stop:1515 length:435 start_codon:yes stop_codon:yes gene_type:complete
MKQNKVEKSKPVFRDDKHVLLTMAIIIGVALVAFNFDKITGGAITEPNSLSVFQDGKHITVQVNYPTGKYGKPNNIVDMRAKVGAKRYDVTTECDLDRGYVSKGTSSCKREIAEFLISGGTWSVGEDVVFSVRGTNIKRDYTLR